MDKIRIKGGADLFGSINISGSKNAALPILVSSLLSKKDLYLSNIADLEDIKSMIQLLESLGVEIAHKDKNLVLNAKKLKNNIADYDLVRKMRASILVLGPLLARFGEAKISLPGGCAIGTRPIDIHLDALSLLGVKFKSFLIREISKTILLTKTLACQSVKLINLKNDKIFKHKSPNVLFKYLILDLEPVFFIKNSKVSFIDSFFSHPIL